MEDSIGSLTRYILYHFKSIEQRLKWSKSLNDFKQQDKHVLNKAILKVSGGLNEFLSIVRNPDLVTRIKADLEKPDLADYMVLTEQLFDLGTEDLAEVTELIDNYLKQKHDNIVQERLEGKDSSVEHID